MSYKIEFLGAFAIKDEGNGCLTSVYNNQEQNEDYPECCKLIAGFEKVDFQGDYHSTWIESDEDGPTGQSNPSVLKIRKASPHAYTLNWCDEDDEVIFKGHGMIRNGELVGAYWQETKESNQFVI